MYKKLHYILIAVLLAYSCGQGGPKNDPFEEVPESVLNEGLL